MQLQSTLVAALALGASFVSAQSQQHIPITGASVEGNGALPIRQNINDLVRNRTPQRTLYIRAIDAMYRDSAGDPLSYFQVAGIHGQPYIEWNGAGARNNQGWGGYCPHGESIFLTWHRPYVALYEQVLVETAVRLAEEYSGPEYQDAARTLRSPFWDWGLGEGVPAVTSQERIEVEMPDGSTTQVDNPLFRYSFPAAARNGTLGRFPERMNRCSASGESYPATANSLLGRRPYKRWVFDALTRPTTFDAFASTGAGTTSLEMIHNGIHWDGGCGGQFLAAETSAFDPLFWMHHTNVDRNWAYFQAIRPDENFEGSYSGQARWQTPAGTQITPRSALEPFYGSNGEFLTSEGVVDYYNFGYTYEGLERGKSENDKRDDALTLVNCWYGDQCDGQRSKRGVSYEQPGSSDGSSSSSPSGLSSVTRPSSTAGGETQPSGTPGTYTSGGKKIRYFAGIKVDVEELDRPCAVNVYVKDQLAGSFVVMMQPQKGTYNGEFTIDEAVESGGYKSNSTLGNVRDGVKIEIVKPDGTKIPVDKVPSLKIEVESCPFTPPKANNELPTYGQPTRQPVPPVQYNGGGSDGGSDGGSSPAPTGGNGYTPPGVTSPAAGSPTNVPANDAARVGSLGALAIFGFALLAM